MKITSTYNKYLQLYQYGPETAADRALFIHCNPKGECFVDSMEELNHIAGLLRRHGEPVDLVQEGEKVSRPGAQTEAGQ